MKTKKLNYLTPAINQKLQDVGDQTSGLVKDMAKVKANVSDIDSKISSVKVENNILKIDFRSTGPATPVVPTITLDTTTKKVSLSASSGLSIKYTTQADGTPSTAYTEAIDVSEGATIKAITTNSAGTSSTLPSITITYQEGETDGTLIFPTGSTYTKNGGASTDYSTPLTPNDGDEYKVTLNGNTATINITA